MAQRNDERDYITIEDEMGNKHDYSVEGLFDHEEDTYALLKGETDTIFMKVENVDGEQYLVNIDDDEKMESLLDAYEIAKEATMD